MKKNTLLWVALAFFLLPIIIRIGWYYRGFYFGNATAELPPYEEILIPQPSLSTPGTAQAQVNNERITIIFDNGHLNRISINEVEPFIKQLQANGVEVITLQTKQALEPLLRGAQAFISIAPTDPFKADELQALARFTQRGGRLILIADPTRSYTDSIADRDKSVVVANQVLAQYGIIFRNDYIYNIERYEGNFRNVYLKPFGTHVLTSGVEEIVFYGAHSISGNGIPIYNGDEKTLSSQTDQNDQTTAVMLSRDGNVLALSDMTFMTAPFNLVKDNPRLISNLAEFVSKPRSRDLTDFPVLFSRQVGVILTSNVGLTKDMFNAISNLQDSLESERLTLSILEEPAEGLDLIIVGTYPPNDEVLPYLMDGPITFNGNPYEKPESETQTTAISEVSNAALTPTSVLADNKNVIRIEGFGEMPLKGFSYFIYKSTEKQNILVLLAERTDFTAGLLKVLASGSLKGCLVKSSVAVCKQDGAFISTPEPTKSAELASPTPTYSQNSTPTPTN